MRRRRRSWSGLALVVGLGAVALFAIGSALSTGSPASASAAPSAASRAAGSGAPASALATSVVLASGVSVLPSGASTGPIDGIACEPTLNVAYHGQVHLQIVVDGVDKPVPKGIGIPGRCIYWIHTYAADGVIDVEAPRQAAFTLGQFFDIWHQPLTTTQIGPYGGTAGDTFAAYVNGHLFVGNPREIPLNNGWTIKLQLTPA